MNKDQLGKLLRDAVLLNGGTEGEGLAEALREAYDWGESKQPDGYKIALEDNYGGEGQGEEYWVVFSVTSNIDGGQTFVKFDGYYSSYGGSEFESDDFEIVESRPVTVNQWFKV